MKFVPLLLCASVAAAAPKKFALAVFHYNVQYVAGGMVGYTPRPDPTFDLDERAIEDQIIVESFEPVLDLFARHPTWGADLEMQGYMLDVIAERHPAILDKLRAVTSTGQVDVPSFHYGDQLFLAYPREDWERSADLNRATFMRHGIPLSTTVFCQEGQAGPALAEAMKERGWRTLVWPKNLFSYQRGDGERAPLYRFGDGLMVTSQGAATPEVEVAWTFVDDGELLATNGVNPYFPTVFRKDASAVAKYEGELAALEKAGYTITTVARYVKAVEGLVKPIERPPPLLDGTWQPGSTDGVLRWMGGMGLWPEERDNDVRALGALAHRELMAAETAAKVAGLDARAELDAAWRLLALGQVTDASGINPFRGEIEYGLAHFAEILRIARGIIRRSATDRVAIDTLAGTVRPAPTAIEAPSATAPVDLTVDGGDRAVTVRWTLPEEKHWIVTVRFEASESRTLSVKFPGTDGDIVYTPGLATGPVHVPRAGFRFDHFHLALSDGLIGLGGDRWLIKDQARVHLAARIEAKSGDVSFRDDTAPVGEAQTWVFHVIESDEGYAAASARALNVLPTVVR